jgi:hypothetical protein
MTPPRDPSRSGKVLWISCTVAFGVACFFAGRMFVLPSADRSVVPIVGPARTVAEQNESQTSLKRVVPVEAPVAVKRSSATSGWDDAQWNEALSRPGTPARQATLAGLLEKLAATDPDRALALAQAEANLKLRAVLVSAAVRGWARTSPTNAANWALALSDANERDRALSTVFTGAVAANPNDAVRLGKFLIQQNSVDGASCGASLITALCDDGHFEIAARMAAEGESSMRAGWMANAYCRWAEFQPEQAARTAAAIKDPELRTEALHGMVGGWAEADPVGLVQFVTELPENERGPLLSQSLQRWAKQDPEGASQWINNHEARSELDVGVAAVATMDSIKPTVAIGWAESVSDPGLRSETLVTVIRNWLTTDLPSARHYFDSSKNLLPDDRQELSEVFSNFSRDSTK